MNIDGGEVYDSTTGKTILDIENVKVEYDKSGRMKLNSFFHYNNRNDWNEDDLDYLINWYDKIGPDEMSFALGRTMGTIIRKVYLLRKQGIMPTIPRVRHKRTSSMKY